MTNINKNGKEDINSKEEGEKVINNNQSGTGVNENFSHETNTKSGWFVKSFLMVILAGAIFAIVVGLLSNNSYDDRDMLIRTVKNEIESRIKMVEKNYGMKIDSISIDLLDMESHIGKLAAKVDTVNERLIKAEGGIVSDKEERAQAELKKILINIKEFSRFFDKNKRSKLGEVNEILYGLLSKEKDSQFIDNVNLDPETGKELDSTPKENKMLDLEVKEDSATDNLVAAPDEEPKIIEKGTVEASETIEILSSNENNISIGEVNAGEEENKSIEEVKPEGNGGAIESSGTEGEGQTEIIELEGAQINSLDEPDDLHNASGEEPNLEGNKIDSDLPVNP